MNEPTVDELKTEVTILVSEVAHLQRMVEHARIKGQREIIEQIEMAIEEAPPGYRLPSVEQIIVNWLRLNA